MTAVLDRIKDKTAQLEHFERELIIQQAELDGWIAEEKGLPRECSGAKGQDIHEPTTLGCCRVTNTVIDISRPLF